ncbi:MAG: site-specific integrase [Verrucomicrobia bacterium]|nr:site-specific integrase [Verrucomicrobiota bacterium]
MATDWERAAEKARAGRLIEESARSVISEMVEYATGRPLEFETVTSWFKVWLEGKEKAKAGATAARYRQVCRDFLAHLGPRANINLAALRVDDVESFRTAELRQGKSVGTVRVAIKAIGAALNAARRQGLVNGNVAALEAIPEQRVAKHTFTPEQLSALLRVADSYRNGEWGTLVRLGYFVGGRLSSLARLRWGQIDLAAGTLKLPAVKGQAALDVPIAAELAEHLQSLPSADSDAAPLMPKLAAKGAGGEHGLSKTFGGLMDAAKIANPILREAAGDKGRTVRALGFHSLRHTFNSRLANAGVSQEVRRKLTGHQSDAMNDRYTHLEAETLRQAVAKLPGIDTKK